MIPNTKYVDVSAIPDDALVRFRKLAVENVLNLAPTFGEWLRQWCQCEELCRKQTPDSRPRQHVIALPPCLDWSDRDVGQALRAATALSYIELHVCFSDFVDRIVLGLSEEAAGRLESDA